MADGRLSITSADARRETPGLCSDLLRVTGFSTRAKYAGPRHRRDRKQALKFPQNIEELWHETVGFDFNSGLQRGELDRVYDSIRTRPNLETKRDHHCRRRVNGWDRRRGETIGHKRSKSRVHGEPGSFCSREPCLSALPRRLYSGARLR